MNSLSEIAKEVAAAIDCTRPGSCFPFAEQFANRVEDGATIHEGLVRFRGSVALPHNWITTDAGETLDPTLAQFDFFDLATVRYFPAVSYTPAEYRQEAARKRS